MTPAPAVLTVDELAAAGAEWLRDQWNPLGVVMVGAAAAGESGANVHTLLHHWRRGARRDVPCRGTDPLFAFKKLAILKN